MGSNPCRLILLLGIAHLVEGSLFQVQGVFGMTTLTRGRFLEKSRIVALVDTFCITCIKILNLNICLY